MKRADPFRLYERYPDQYVATLEKSGRPVAHSRSLRKLYASLKRRRIDPNETIVEKVPPKDAVVIYGSSDRTPLLLGQEGFLDLFDVAFDNRQKKVVLSRLF